MQTNLFLKRLVVVTHQNQYAYDQNFHRGVNIIRGQNSSGKSTIIRFIFYVLGGCYGDFVPEAMACQWVMAEVETGGKILTLKRSLERTEDGSKVNRYNPMYIHFGPMTDVILDSGYGWQKYPYRSSSERYSFSNVLFKLIGLPDFKADSTITMHQILRLIYLDQESPLSSLFFFEQFDKELTRTMVAELLMGLYDEQLSQAKHRHEEVQKRLAEVKQTLKLTREFLTDPTTQSSAFILQRIDNLNREMQEITEEVQALRAESGSKIQDTSSKKGVQGSLFEVQEFKGLKFKAEYQRLQENIAGLRKQIVRLDDEILSLKNEIEDSGYFLSALRRELDMVENAIHTREYFDSLHLQYCPVCLGELDHNHEDGHCHLCKEPIDSDKNRQKAERVHLELQFQIDESGKLLAQREECLKEKEALRKGLRRQLNDAQKQYDQAVNHVRSTHEERIDQLLQDKGYKEGEIAQMRTLLEYAEKYEALLKEQSDLNNENAELTRLIEAKNKQIGNERRRIERAISENGVFLLKHDQDRQAEFRNATDFRMDFEQNVAYLTDQHIKLSASSAFYLKMTARFAFFLSSVQEDSMMYPRLLLSDNMEDKGMEENRSRNFQRILVQRLQEIGNKDYQVIFATSNIAKELDTPEYTIGEFYTETNKSLKV